MNLFVLCFVSTINQRLPNVTSNKFSINSCVISLHSLSILLLSMVPSIVFGHVFEHEVIILSHSTSVTIRCLLTSLNYDTKVCPGFLVSRHERRTWLSSTFSLFGILFSNEPTSDRARSSALQLGVWRFFSFSSSSRTDRVLWP